MLRGGQETEIYAMNTASFFGYKGQNFRLLAIEEISEKAKLQWMILICSI